MGQDSSQTGEQAVELAVGGNVLGVSAILRPLSRFWAWWTGELSSFVPDFVRRGLGGEPPLRIAKVEGEWRRLGGQDAAPAEQLANRRVVVSLSAQDVLVRRRNLPEASIGHFREIMSLRIASETPFRTEEVFEDAQVIEFVREKNEVEVEQVLAPKSIVLESYRELSELRAKVCGVDIAGVQTGRPRRSYNLLPRDLRASSWSLPGKLNLLLVVALLLALAFVGWAWNNAQSRKLAAVDEAVAIAEAQAAGAIEQQQSVQRNIDAIRHVDAALRDSLRFTSVYEMLARVAPDHTWLEDINYTPPVLVISGMSGASSELIAALEQESSVSTARFSSPVVTDPRYKIDRFGIDVVLHQPSSTTGEAAR